MEQMMYNEWKMYIDEQKSKASFLKNELATFLQEVDMSEEEEYEAEKLYAELINLESILPKKAMVLLNDYDYEILENMMEWMNNKMEIIISKMIL
jgi:putative heme iron utilization protein